MATVKVKVPTSIDSPTPWTLPRTKLICVNINGSEHDAFLCKAGNKAYGLPDGFATGALLNLNTEDLGEVKRFIEAYGLPVSPYANQFELVEKRFISNDKFSNDPVGDGLDCWSDSLNASTRSSDIIETLGFSLFNHYKGKDSSAGTEIANLIKGIRKKDEQIILTEDLATTLTIMQVAALLFSCKAAFGPKAYDKAIPLLKKLPNSDKIKKKSVSFSLPSKCPQRYIWTPTKASCLWVFLQQEFRHPITLNPSKSSLPLFWISLSHRIRRRPISFRIRHSEE